MALSPRQDRFVQEYCLCLEAKKAAELAGYSAKTARQCGSRLLAFPHVAAAIQEALEQRAEHVEVKVAEVLRELKLVAFSKEERTSDRLKALEMLGRFKKMFSDKVEVSGDLRFEQLVLRADVHYREAAAKGEPLLAAVGVAADGATIYVPDPYKGRGPPAASAFVEMAPSDPPAAPATPAPAAAAPAPAPAATPAPRPDLWHPTANPRGIGVPLGESGPQLFALTAFNPFRKPDHGDA